MAGTTTKTPPEQPNLIPESTTAYHRYIQWMRDHIINHGRCGCGALFETHLSEREIVEDLVADGFNAEDWGDNPHNFYWERQIELLQDRKKSKGIKGGLDLPLDSEEYLTNKSPGNLRVPLRFTCKNCFHKTEKEKLAEIRRNRIVNLKRHLKHYGLISKEMLGDTYESVDPELIWGENQFSWKTMENWTPNKGNVWIQGDPGVGKTFLSRCVLNAHLDLGCSVAELYGNRLKSIAEDFNARKELERFFKVKILVLDDVHKPQWSGRALDGFDELMNYRQDHALRTIVTSNINATEFTKRLHEFKEPEWVSAFIDRFALMGFKNLLLTLTGKSIRRES
jgi:DNA replication protein DnaC